MNASIDNIAETLSDAGHTYAGSNDEETREIAVSWAEAGFGNDAVAEWIAVGTFQAAAAEDMARIGMTPDMASTPSDELGESETVGYAVSNGDITALVALGIALVAHGDDLDETDEDDVAGEENIDALRGEAAEAGDLDTVALCDLAQTRRSWREPCAEAVQARRRVDRIISSANAMRD